MDSNSIPWISGGGEMGKLVRTKDWSQTSLGPIENWPQSLRTAVQMVLAAPFPNIVLWGPDLIQVYNDGYRDLMGIKHPIGLGQSNQECWPEVWHINEPIYQRVWQGESLFFEKALYPLASSGVPEDTWLTLSYSPILDESGAVAGVLVTVLDVTQQFLAEKVLRTMEERQRFLLLLTDALRPLSDPAAVQYEAARVLGEYLRADRVGYAEDGGDGQTVTLTRNYTAPSVPSIEGTYHYWDYGPELLAQMQAGRTVVRSDIANDPTLNQAEKEAHAVLLLGATVNVPLVKEGKLVAILFAHYRDAHTWTPEELFLLEETAERTWAAVERARVEMSLRASEEKYRAMFNSITEGFSLLDVLFNEQGQAYDIIIRDANPAQDRIDGVRALIGKRVRELLPNIETKWIERYGKVARSGEPEHFVDWSEANQRWYEVGASRVGGPGSSLVAIVYSDITERKRAEEAVRESEARLQTVYAVAPIILWQMNASGQQILWNPRWQEYTGQTFAQSQNDGWMDAIHPEDQPNTARVFQEAYSTGLELEVEQRIRRHDGVYRWFLVRQVPLHDENGAVAQWFGAATDMHELHELRAGLEAKVAERTTELTQALSGRQALVRRVVSAQEQERRRISRELHDQMGQYIAAFGMGLKNLEPKLPEDGDSVELKRLRHIASEMAKEVHRLAVELRPTALDDLGLIPALRGYIQEWSEHVGVAADFAEMGMDSLRLSPDAETVIYRIVQEALTNVAKHAIPEGATNITTMIQRRDNIVQITIDDDGPGFDTETATRSGRLGVAGMQERAELIGGSLEIESSLGKGTTVYLRVPIS